MIGHRGICRGQLARNTLESPNARFGVDLDGDGDQDLFVTQSVACLNLPVRPKCQTVYPL